MIRIGGASGYWGESAMATPQLLEAGVDVLVYDYLAEITMSLLARAKMKDPEGGGYAKDFVSAAMKPHLAEIAEKGVKVVSNAGGINPQACGKALRELIDRAGVDLKVAVVEGDDLKPRLAEIAEAGVKEMFSGAPLPHPMTVVSMNAYLGAFPIAAALDAGADIVVTGRCVDSAVTLGALIAHYGWQAEDLDLLAAGSLVGHLLECGPQATGGNFTDWRDVTRRAAIGYPVAEVEADGTAVITKPGGTGGLVSRGTVTEQLVYEIGDPSDYVLPDVRCDFSSVQIEETGKDRVRVSGAKGRPPPQELKVCATHVAGWRGGLTPTFYGFEASEKAEEFAAATLARAEETLRAANLAPFTEVSVEVIGTGTMFGETAPADEVVLKLAARHPEQDGIAVLLKEAAGMGLATPPGLCGFAGARPKPSPVVQLYSFLIDRSRVEATFDLGSGPQQVHQHTPSGEAAQVNAPTLPPAQRTDDMVSVMLIEAAWARSGDKGDSANVGVIARHPDLLPYLWEQLTEGVVAERFAHVLEGDVSRFAMPGPHAINFLLTRSLGGGGIASLRNDPQGKGFSQIMLTIPVEVPESLLREAWS
ncbi:acyclic terpene utilization AtuA family protein [Parvularcula lutaonensis]|uniref:Acyclic terpene utilization AtuA family protein n=1 Tax=Parvularcula lutaonensis TaxID=491923 RepID=A0ABV7MAM0_9PROT|nr:acyclic terpene utilization AtuA family protein [Parvularcula lutaonensis]GGY38096.1 hypothetical protein GCM10007148_02960 [Parvularcula lutaonensis]